MLAASLQAAVVGINPEWNASYSSSKYTGETGDNDEGNATSGRIFGKTSHSDLS
jgi:hypothetical protein